MENKKEREMQKGEKLNKEKKQNYMENETEIEEEETEKK